MKKKNLSKIAIVVVVFVTVLAGFAFSSKSRSVTQNSADVFQSDINGKNEVEGYKSWTKVSKNGFVMDDKVSQLCASPVIPKLPVKGSEVENSPHKDKYINVYVNSIGKDEMLTKKDPKFPVGTVVVKEKFTSQNDLKPELLTVMIKRAKGFNPSAGDWEFMTLNGDATKVTSKGKLESCQACHIGYKQNDYITRTYLTDQVKQNLK